MVNTAHAWECDDLRLFGWPQHDPPRLWTVFGQAQVRPVLVIVVQVSMQKPKQMLLTQRDHVVEKLSPHGSNPALRGRILPGAMERDALGLGSERFNQTRQQPWGT